MEGTTPTDATPEPSQALVCRDEGQASPFSEQWVTITKEEHIELNWRAKYWEAQHARVKSQLEEARQEIILRDAKIKDLQNRLFGKKTEKDKAAKSEKGNYPNPPCKRNRGQQPGSQGHGRTQRPDLP
jgi:transposase